MENIYYVYAYLDPRKPGNFKYDNYEFKFEPFYIGKGKNNRLNYHWKCILNETESKLSNIHFVNKLNKIKNNNLSPIIIKIEYNLRDNKSFEKEKELISLIGRSYLKEGPLVNITSGGQGKGSYRTRSDKGKKRKPLSEELKRKLSIIHTGKTLSEEHKESISKNSKSPAETWTEESKKKNRETRREKWPTKEELLEAIKIHKYKCKVAKEIGFSHPTIETMCEFYDIKIDWKNNLGKNQYSK